MAEDIELHAALEADMNAVRFKQVMRKLAASVTVITTAHNDELHGMTATAVCSVSAEPPQILVVINKTARTHPIIDSAGFFSVNILARDQRHIAERFSTKDTNQFEGVPHGVGRGFPSPVLQGASAFLECKLTSRLEAGSHTIFIGQVLYCGTSEADPLLYYNGNYTELVLTGSS